MLLCCLQVNPEYVSALSAAGLHFTGTDERGVRMEIVELDRAAHPFFFAVQYHPGELEPRRTPLFLRRHSREGSPSEQAVRTHTHMVRAIRHIDSGSCTSFSRRLSTFTSCCPSPPSIASAEFQSSPHCPSPPFLGLILAAKGELEKRLPLDLTAARRARGLAIGGSSGGAAAAHGGAGGALSTEAGSGAFGGPLSLATPPRGTGSASASASAPGSPLLHGDGSSAGAGAGGLDMKRSSFTMPAAAGAGAPAVVGRMREELLPSSAGTVMKPFESSPLRPPVHAGPGHGGSGAVAAGSGRAAHPPLASGLVDGASGGSAK